MAAEGLVHSLEERSLKTKLNLLKLCNRTSIHIGGDLSSCDMVTAIWQYAMRYDSSDPHWPGRDRFVLSKGHAAAVVPFSQAAIGCYQASDIFDEYATNFGRFGMHSCNLANPYVDVSTGSLGHGLPVATGRALALRRAGSGSRVYVMCGDGECEEGSIWESALFAHQYRLGNLIVFVDRNKVSCDGPTEELMSLDPFEDKWKAFGWNVLSIDGNDMGQVVDAIDSIPNPTSDRPTVIVGNTTKGNGVSFMEGNAEWHLNSLTDEQYRQAVAEVKASYAEKWGEA